MGSFLLLLQPFLLLIFIQGVGAFVYSCEEVKYKIINSSFSQATRYVCIVAQEGYSNWGQLDGIYATVDGHSTSFSDIADIDCLENKAGNSPWKFFADSGLSLNCNQEFSLILTSDPPTLIKPESKTSVSTLKENKRNIFVVPQNGMLLKTLSCIGNSGIVKFWTGAGSSESEHRYSLRQWPCQAIPEFIMLIDNVVTIETVDSKYSVETKTDISDWVDVQPSTTITLLISGRSDNLHNLKDSIYSMTVLPTYWEECDVSINMQLTFDESNHGSIALLKDSGEDIPPTQYRNGSYTEKFTTSWFEIIWDPTKLQPTEIAENNDFINIDISMSAVTLQPAGDYCTCPVDDNDFPEDWKYDEIWLDMIVILDTSEAMTSAALTDAEKLIESFFSDGKNNLLTTDPNAPMFSRVGLIVMSDDAEVLYNLNMTSKDKIQGKLKIAKGVSQIDVIYAYTTAMNMFNEGLKNHKERAIVRQVIYYMTATDPTNLNAINQFKDSGIVIVNNFSGGRDLPGLENLASVGFYLLKADYKLSMQAFCKANCYCKSSKVAHGGNEPANKASDGCYAAQKKALAFEKARTFCAEDTGIIATVHDDDKRWFLHKLLGKVKYDSFWIGYQKQDDGTWKWEDDSSDPYTDWDWDEPQDNPVSKCAYVDMDDDRNYKWGAANCQIAFPYVCQYPPCAVGNNVC